MADRSEVDNLLENVEEFVNDENKIVTYEFLSQNCGIHVNLAKTVLERFVEELKKKKKDKQYQVVYSLAGYVGKNIKVLLVKDTNLEDAKLKLDKIISLHTYSVQKGKLERLGLLYNSNLTEFKKSIQQCCSQSGISCPAAKLKSVAESAPNTSTEIKEYKEQLKPAHPTLKKEQESLEASSSKPGSSIESEPAKHDHSKIKEKAPSKLAAKKTVGKPAIAAFFANQQAIGRVNPVKDTAEKKEVVEEIKNSVNGKRVVREPSDDESENKDINVEPTKTAKRFKLSEEEKPVKSYKTKTTANKAKKTTKTSQKTQRKRIQQFSDSESNDEDEDEQEIALSSPEMPTQVPVPMSEDDDDVLNATVVEPSKNPKRSRKLVAKTYMDKDGYVVTSREYETCEEKEVPELPPQTKEKEKSKEIPKIDTQPSTKHPSPPGKTKQKSITSFFTRK